MKPGQPGRLSFVLGPHDGKWRVIVYESSHLEADGGYAPTRAINTLVADTRDLVKMKVTEQYGTVLVEERRE